MPKYLTKVEREFVVEALRQTGGVKARAALLLGINRTTLVEKMRKFGMPLNPSNHRSR